MTLDYAEPYTIGKKTKIRSVSPLFLMWPFCPPDPTPLAPVTSFPCCQSKDMISEVFLNTKRQSVFPSDGDISR